ncbi:ImmA/IrrE family metallo-endopeptidase [Sedimenticola selenatireducens]|nr:ImmA/IrrE family metallo-endopeptidase [Sedimenticola selenatireducens]
MSTKYRDQIRMIRLLLGNPYAYLNDVGEFDAISNQSETGKALISSSRRKYQNQYAHINGTGGFDALPKTHKRQSAYSPPDSINISASRKSYGNQYAHLNDTGFFDHSPKAQTPRTYSRSPKITSVAARRRELGNPYAFLNDTGGFDTADLGESTLPRLPLAKLSSIAKLPGKNPVSRIEQLAHEIQVEIWNLRQQMWPDGVPTDPVDLLDPSITLGAIGFNYALSDSLGYFPDRGTGTKVAGYIDQSKKSVRISRHLPYETLRFTAAHELGHAILHNDIRMHRDRAIDGSVSRAGRREQIEVEADKFASVFLMPEKLLRIRFKQIFMCERFALNHETAFALDPSGLLKLNNKNITRRELARILAKAERYNTRHVIPLFMQFKVSMEAMAIRIEELDLIGM